MTNKNFPLSLYTHTSHKSYCSIQEFLSAIKTCTHINLSTFQSISTQFNQYEKIKRKLPCVAVYGPLSKKLSLVRVQFSFERKSSERLIDHDSILLRIDHLFLTTCSVRRHWEKYKKRYPSCFLVTRCNNISAGKAE